MAKKIYPALSDEYLSALRVYRDAAGTGWKNRLIRDWMRAGTDVYEAKPIYALLHQLRNARGPVWLTDSFDESDLD